MKLLLTFLCLHCCFSHLWGQDTLVFKIRKKNECAPVSVAAQPPLSPTVDTAKQVEIVKHKPTIYSKTPTLAKGANFWSLRWERYVDGMEERLGADADYAVFDFTVDSLGMVKKINIYKYSSRTWVNTFGRELQKTLWVPAENEEGQATEYPFVKHIVHTLGPVNENE
jgi:hypothetical protein